MPQIKLNSTSLLVTLLLLLIQDGHCQVNHRSNTKLNQVDQNESILAANPSSSSETVTKTADYIDVKYNGNNSEGNDTDDDNGGHHGIHVASLRFEYVQQPIIITLFLIVAAISKLGFHHANFLSSIVPESCLLIVLGLIVGVMIKYSGSADAFPLTLSPTLFFLYLLPPVILESAYSLHDRDFFDNIGTILVYAVIGTLLNCFILGPVLYGLAKAGAMGTISISFIQSLVFCSLIVAVDPVAVLAIFQEIGVNNVLYFLVFGESLLNDAVTVVLYNTMTVFLEMDTIPARQIFLAIASFFADSLGGLAIGILFGVITAVVTKYTRKVRVVEPLAVLTFAYASYLTAELFHFSGIISMIGCGLVQARYAFHNISNKSLITVSYVSKILSGTSDAVIFMFLGLALITGEKHQWHTGFILWTVFLTLIFRFVVVYGLTFIANRVWRFRKVDLEEQFIMAYGGLRGAVAFSLVVMLDRDILELKNVFVTSTLSVIIFTVFIQGITIKPLVKLLKIRKESQEAVTIFQEINNNMMDHWLAGVEGIVGQIGSNFVREKIGYFDDKYVKRWLQKHPRTKDEVIIDLFQEVALQLHYESVAVGADLKRYRSGVKPELIKQLTMMPGGEEAMSDMMEHSPDFPHEDDLHDDIGRDRVSRKHSTFRKKTDDVRERVSRKQSTFRKKMDDDRRRVTRKQSTFRKKTDDVESGAGSSHHVPRMRRKQSGAAEHEPVSMREKKKSQRRSVISSFLGLGKNDNEYKEDPTVDDVRRWFDQTPKMNDIHKRRDRNITRDDETDIIHQLCEKQRRQARTWRHSRTSDYSDHLPIELFGEQGINSRAAIEERGETSVDTLPVILDIDETTANGGIIPEGDEGASTDEDEQPSNDNNGRNTDHSGVINDVGAVELESIEPQLHQGAKNDETII